MKKKKYVCESLTDLTDNQKKYLNSLASSDFVPFKGIVLSNLKRSLMAKGLLTEKGNLTKAAEKLLQPPKEIQVPGDSIILEGAHGAPVGHLEPIKDKDIGCTFFKRVLYVDGGHKVTGHSISLQTGERELRKEFRALINV